MARLADGPDFKAAVCASAGNLGLALAYSGQRRGISTTVVAGSGVNPYKLERIRALGATVRIVDGDIEDARDPSWSRRQRLEWQRYWRIDPAIGVNGS